MPQRAFIAGLSGPELTADERAFFAEAQPWGYILFGRNVQGRAQLRALTDSLRELSGRADLPILIDQEGGRVARMRPPHWPAYAPARRLGDLYRRDREVGLRAAWLQSRLIGLDLVAAGINVDCLPVLDTAHPETHSVIGDRAYSDQPFEVAELGRAACDGLLAAGVLPVIKHMPGHGRATADSHIQLPVVDCHPAILGCTDFYPFMQLADMPLAMTAHLMFTQFDSARPTTQSPRLIGEILRGWLGFDGLLMSDDLSMQALSGDFAERTRATFAAGCDVVLHCNGIMAEMVAVAGASPDLAGESARRARLALDRIAGGSSGVDEAGLRGEYEGLLAA